MKIRSFYYKAGIKIKIALSFIFLVCLIIFFSSFQTYDNQKMIINETVENFVSGYINSSSKVLLEYITLDQPLDILIFIKNFAVSLPQIKNIIVYQTVNTKNLKLIENKSGKVSNTEKSVITDLLPPAYYQIFNFGFYVDPSFAKIRKLEVDDNIVFSYPIVFIKDRVELDKEYVRMVGYMNIYFSKTALYQPIKDTVYSMINVSLFWLFIGIVLVFIFSFLITKPIYLIISAVKRIRGGDLGFTIEIKSSDEFGLLSSQFNDMLIHLREKLEMQKFVSRQTTKVIESKVREGGGLEPHRENVVVFFADIRGFTTISEALDPTRVIELLNFYFEEMSKIVIENGGDIDKYVGDQIFAVFRGDDKEKKAVHTAIRIQEMIRSKNNEINTEYKLEVGIGINSGEVVAGKMGSSIRMDYTVIGDVVNTGARLCSIAGGGEIVVSQNIQELLSNTYSFVKKDKIKLKGKSKEVIAYSVLY
ncbi:MAG TPA: adenylate/guanylate cyclase domain-containing protein [Spirochaetota bacterium]|nr:adenylate/guanylate cyclase domain-containing protein [Spirochaetota bacterium]HOM38934.1 adenylate/guanylate cyclase domain-containing protein [Spirochaetota bacterium]HPQ49192.1 adenylate/guanylate cyclase domain-containing protein [Spirochaetota bacterium]